MRKRLTRDRARCPPLGVCGFGGAGRAAQSADDARLRRVARVGGAAAARARPRDGLLVVDRDGGGVARTPATAPGTSSRATRCSSPSASLAASVAFQVPMKAWQKLAPWLFVAGVVLLVARADARHRQERQRLAPLALARRRQRAAVRVHEARGRALRGELRRAQGGVPARRAAAAADAGARLRCRCSR